MHVLTPVPASTAHLYHLDDFLCCGHIDLLQAHNLNLLSIILQNPQLGLLIQQVEHLNQTGHFTFRVVWCFSLIESMNVSMKAGGAVVYSYFSIVNLKEADIDRQIQASKPPMVKVGENILGCKRKDTKTIKSQVLIQETRQILSVL